MKCNNTTILGTDPFTTRLFYRAYDPDLARWLNQDPIGENGGINLYRFVGNDPLNRIDPLGLYGNPVSGPNGPVGPSSPYDLGQGYANGYLYPTYTQPPSFNTPWTFAGGTDLHLSWINPFTSGGGGVIGHNQMTFLGNQNQTKCYEYNGSGYGFDLGVGAQSVWAWGSGNWTGTFDSVPINYGPLTGSIFWSPGPGGWVGFTYGVSLGPPAGAAYEQTEYYDDIDE